MITIKNVRSLSGEIKTVTIPATRAIELEASGLTMLPAVIDPHVHFRTPVWNIKKTGVLLHRLQSMAVAPWFLICQIHCRRQ